MFCADGSLIRMTLCSRLGTPSSLTLSVVPAILRTMSLWIYIRLRCCYTHSYGILL
jgi:hypothetical protein